MAIHGNPPACDSTCRTLYGLKRKNPALMRGYKNKYNKPTNKPTGTGTPYRAQNLEIYRGSNYPWCTDPQEVP